MIVRVVVTTFVVGGVYIDSIYVGVENGRKQVEGGGGGGEGRRGKRLSGPKLATGELLTNLSTCPNILVRAESLHGHFCSFLCGKPVLYSARMCTDEVELDLAENFLHVSITPEETVFAGQTGNSKVVWESRDAPRRHSPTTHDEQRLHFVYRRTQWWYT